MKVIHDCRQGCTYDDERVLPVYKKMFIEQMDGCSSVAVQICES